MEETKATGEEGAGLADAAASAERVAALLKAEEESEAVRACVCVFVCAFFQLGASATLTS